MDQEQRTLDFLRLFVRHQQEIYAYILTLVPNGARPRPGEPLRVGAYDLRDGVAQMELGQGISLLLEAPCQVEHR